VFHCELLWLDNDIACLFCQAPLFRCHHEQEMRYRDMARELGLGHVVDIRSDTGVGLVSVLIHLQILRLRERQMG